MPTADQHQSSKFTKFLYIGDSSTGKTGSLASLAKAGYSFRCLDLDDGLDPFINYARAEGCDLSKIEFETVRDEYRASKTGPVIKGQPKAFVAAMEVLETWAQIEDPNCFVVLDSLTFLGKAAYAWAKGMNPLAKEPRTWFYAAQQALESVLALLTGPSFKQNVIVISHVNYKEVTEGVHKGFPSAVGSALGPTVASYFNTLVLAEVIGSGANAKRKIKTLPTGVIDLKISTPKAEADYPLATGLASIVEVLKAS